MFVASIPMGSDIFFEPIWTKNIGEPVTADAAKFGAKGIEAFNLGDRYGYFTPDGTILSSVRTDERLSVSPSAWTTYSQNPESTVIHRPDGSERASINAAGYVHLDGTRTYLFLPGGDAISQYDDKGKLLWTREHTAPITAFNSSPAGTITGYADGQLTLTRKDGSTAFSFYPGGSDYPVILGAAVSDDGTLAACVSGIDRQRIILIRITGNQYKVIFHAYLEGNLRRQAYVDFEKNSSSVLFECAKGIGIIDCKKNAASFIPFEGKIVTTGECPGDKLVVALMQNGNAYTLAAIEQPNHLIASLGFTAKHAFLLQREEAIFLGMDDRISRINIRGIK
jgi:hypothetical protein